jgi:hypothetical protein
MNVRQIVLPLPEAMTVETIEMLEEASALVFRALRQGTHPPRCEDVGAAEYESWTAGAVEYDSWSAARH